MIDPMNIVGAVINDTHTETSRISAITAQLHRYQAAANNMDAVKKFVNRTISSPMVINVSGVNVHLNPVDHLNIATAIFDYLKEEMLKEKEKFFKMKKEYGEHYE